MLLIRLARLRSREEEEDVYRQDKVKEVRSSSLWGGAGRGRLYGIDDEEGGCLPGRQR